MLINWNVDFYWFFCECVCLSNSGRDYWYMLILFSSLINFINFCWCLSIFRSFWRLLGFGLIKDWWFWRKKIPWSICLATLIQKFETANSFSDVLILLINCIAFSCGGPKGSGSGGQISWDQNSLFQEIEWFFNHEIKFFYTFHEVKIPNNDLISWSRHFSWTSTIMRSKFKTNYLNLLSWTCG